MSAYLLLALLMFSPPSRTDVLRLFCESWLEIDVRVYAEEWLEEPSEPKYYFPLDPFYFYPSGESHRTRRGDVNRDGTCNLVDFAMLVKLMNDLRWFEDLRQARMSFMALWKGD